MITQGLYVSKVFTLDNKLRQSVVSVSQNDFTYREEALTKFKTDNLIEITLKLEG